MNFITTVKGSMMEKFFPEGWDLDKIDKCCSNQPAKIFDRQKWWNKEFTPIACETLDEFNIKMGHEIANEIYIAGKKNKKLILILPVGPMG
ncbi:MAG: glucosamine-6-phosphate isomerase, partial [Actinobacteria bacterium]|nr:glucosamine-6-phosphate isomerase [Actinomycetota bacterium]